MHEICKKCCYSDICQKTSKKFLSRSKFVYFGKKLASLNDKNFEYMFFQFKYGIRKGLFLPYSQTFEKMEKLKMSALEYFSQEEFDYEYYFDEFFLHLLKVQKKEEKITHLDLYPKCCTQSYYDNNLETFRFLLPYLYSKSDFYCPLLNYNMFLSDEEAKTSNIFPYYIMCSLNCYESIHFARISLKYIKNLDLDNFFIYLKSPILFYRGVYIIFNGYYDKGIIYYNGLYCFDGRKVIFKNKLNITFVKNKNIIIPGMKKTMNDVYLKYISK